MTHYIVSHPLPPSSSLPLSLSLCASLCVCPSPCLSIPLCVCVCVCVSQSLSLFPCLSVLLQYLCYYIFCYYSFTRSDTVIIYCNNNHLIIINWTTAVIHKSVCVCTCCNVSIKIIPFPLHEREEGEGRERGRGHSEIKMIYFLSLLTFSSCFTPSLTL